MANIYKEKEVADYQNRFYSSKGNIGRQLLREAPQHERQAMALENQAQNLYSKGLEIEWQNTANELLNNPDLSKNPKGLQEELKKVTNDIAGTIEDKEVKLDFLVNAELNGKGYIKSAENNLIKKQHEQQTFQTLKSIDGYFDDIALSLGNLMNDNYNVDDYIKLSKSISDIDKAINQKDMRGFDLLSESEKRSIQNRKKTILQHVIINGINSTPLNERIDLVNKISSGEFEMIKGFEDTTEGREIFIGGLDSYLNPESAQYIKAYATGLKDRYDKLKSTSNRNTGLSDREAMDKAGTQTIYDIELPEEIKEIGKIENIDDRTFAYMGERLRAINLFKNKDIDEKTFKKVMDKSAVPLVRDIESTESTHQHWYKPNGAYRDGVDVLKTLNVQTNEEKAYLYTNLYDAMTKDGIDMGSTNSSDKQRAKNLALEIKQEYLENKNPNLVGTEVSKVLLGNDVLEAYKPNKEPKIAKPNWKIWVKNDGKKYKILPDKNGEYTNDSVFIRIGG